MKKSNLLLLIAFIFLIHACSSVQQSVITKDPSYFPTKRKTILTDELACFGNMLSDYSFAESGGNPLPISIVSVTDKTNISIDASHEIPKDMTDLALGVASNIGGPLHIFLLRKKFIIFNCLIFLESNFTIILVILNSNITILG